MERLDILLIEDDPGDVDITIAVLEQNKLRIDIRVAESGQAAMDLLLDETDLQYRPNLILLDLNMPGKNGKEVLKEIKEHPELKKIPVIIVTTSDSEDDITFAYQNGASCYIVKPNGLVQYSNTLKALESFWLSSVKFPSVN